MRKDVLWKTEGLELFFLGQYKLSGENIGFFFPVEKLSKLFIVIILYFTLTVNFFECYNTVKQYLRLLTWLNSTYKHRLKKWFVSASSFIFYFFLIWKIANRNVYLFLIFPRSNARFYFFLLVLKCRCFYYFFSAVFVLLSSQQYPAGVFIRLGNQLC